MDKGTFSLEREVQRKPWTRWSYAQGVSIYNGTAIVHSRSVLDYPAAQRLAGMLHNVQCSFPCRYCLCPTKELYLTNRTYTKRKYDEINKYLMIALRPGEDKGLVTDSESDAENGDLYHIDPSTARRWLQKHSISCVFPGLHPLYNRTNKSKSDNTFYQMLQEHSRRLLVRDAASRAEAAKARESSILAGGYGDDEDEDIDTSTSSRRSSRDGTYQWKVSGFIGTAMIKEKKSRSKTNSRRKKQGYSLWEWLSADSFSAGEMCISFFPSLRNGVCDDEKPPPKLFVSKVPALRNNDPLTGEDELLKIGNIIEDCFAEERIWDLLLSNSRLSQDVKFFSKVSLFVLTARRVNLVTMVRLLHSSQ